LHLTQKCGRSLQEEIQVFFSNSMKRWTGRTLMLSWQTATQPLTMKKKNKRIENDSDMLCDFNVWSGPIIQKKYAMWLPNLVN